MDKLLVHTKQLDGMIDEVLPMLIADDWQQAAEKMPQVIEMLDIFLQFILEGDPDEELLETTRFLLKRLLFSVQISDSIQLADILAYEVGNMMQIVYENNPC